MADSQEAQILNGRVISQEIIGEISEEVKKMKEETGVIPGLAVLLVGVRKDSQTYVRFKKKGAADCGFFSHVSTLPEDTTLEKILEEVESLNQRDDIHGILVQLPLPKHIDEEKVLRAVRVDKDVDGFSPSNIGGLAMAGGKPLATPCTPSGIIELLKRTNISLSGKRAIVLGRSNIVGLPISLLLMRLDATVTMAHSRTVDLPERIKESDIVVSAIGKPMFVKGEWLKPGCVVIDVGINAYDDPTKKLGYRLVGDVEYESAKKVASWITPVPGGVGPMTIAMLMRNTLNLTKGFIAKKSE